MTGRIRVAIGVAGFLVLATYATIYQFSHPELTQTQLTIQLWPIALIGLAFFGLAAWGWLQSQ